ncbi:MAG: TrkH family potassium uptake protein [Lewinellaceae bacterium]|nr:TrkH family potassium uptake protein [Saprospiraceae bacterium]MCB9331354.1 TrkH family potassium uptake protein [Lewinellaceae bacterium]
MINFGIVSNVIGVVLIGIGVFMLLTLPVCLIYDSGDALPLFWSALFTVVAGRLLYWKKAKQKDNIAKREGYLIVALGWFAVSFVCAIPYLLSDTMPDLANAFFESVSGLTTTGASVLNDIEAVPKGILFWRSLTQWIGGMGIIVLTVAIFPLLGIGGVELFVAEAPGPTSDKIHPRIKETAKRLWLIYVGLTVALCLLLYMYGMDFYDAVNHSFTTMATGGFSTKNASIAYYQSPAIQYIITFFMFMAGVNYTVIYYGLTRRFHKVWRSDEFKAYFLLVIILIALVTTTVYNLTDLPFEQAFRDSAFQILSILTTTGFVTADYTAWTPALTLLFFILLFVGACAGSTAGGIKVIRHLVFFKNSFLEFKRLLHAKALIRIKIDRQLVAPRILTHILVFLLIYMILFLIGSLIMTIILADFKDPLLTAIGAVATCLGNVGPGIGQVGPLDNFSKIPDAGKWVLSVLMLLGRLELFSVLILFMPYFWRTH